MDNRQNKFKTDECYINQQLKESKSILGYMTDASMFVNKNDCLDDTPGFLNYRPGGIFQQNIDIENDLRGSIRNASKCTSCKWTPDDTELISKSSTKPMDVHPNNKKVCTPENKILPNGYFMDIKTMTFIPK